LGKRKGIDLATIGEELMLGEGRKKLCDDIHNCPYLGFVDEKRNRVGCMIHPANNDGRELRDASFYGAKLCNDHECPSDTALTQAEKEGVAAVIDDWYLYGLVITDIDFVKGFFKIAGDILGEEIRPALFSHAGLKEISRSFFDLKESWPYRSSEKRFGKYSFSIAEYRIEREVTKRNLSLPPSKYRNIFISLASDFETEKDFMDAERMLAGMITEFTALYIQPKNFSEEREFPKKAGARGG
jgi:hypothetical protein